MFKKLALAAVGAAALSAVPAHAVTIVFEDNNGDGLFDAFKTTGAFSAGAFSVSNTFATPAGYTLVSASFTSVSNANGDLDVKVAQLNGTNFVGSYSAGNVPTEAGDIGPLTALVPNTLLFSGDVLKPAQASLTGTLVWASVPEPSTWLMMMAGFGALGFALRRQKAATRRVNFNFA